MILITFLISAISSFEKSYEDDRRRSSPRDAATADASSFIVILISLMQITNEIVRGRLAVHSSPLMGTIREALSGDRALSGWPATWVLQWDGIERQREREERTTRQPLMFVSAPRNVHFRLSESRAAVLHCARFLALPPPRDTLESSIQLTFCWLHNRCFHREKTYSHKSSINKKWEDGIVDGNSKNSNDWRTFRLFQL